MIFSGETSDDLILKIVQFDDLDVNTLYDVLALRMSVFCVEQNCPYLDPDGKDKLAWHVLAMFGGELVGTARILMPGEAYPDAVSIGRIANVAKVRGKKVGFRVVKTAVQACDEYFPEHPIRIGAQRYLTGFYEQFGFEVIGEPYLEDGIVHVTMERAIQI